MTSYIGYHNLLESGTVTASTEASGFEKENAYDNNTYDYWKPTALSSINISKGTAQAGGTSSITLDSNDISIENYYYAGTVTITGGTGSGQVRTIVYYFGGSQIASVSPAWTTIPDNTSTYTISLPAATLSLAQSISVGACDYFSVAAHDLFDNSAVIVLQYSGDNFVNDINYAFEPVIVSDNSPLFRAFASFTKVYIRVLLTGAVASLGDVRFGERLEIPSGIPKPFKLLSESRESTRLINKSEGGQKLGNSVIRFGIKGHSLKLRNLTPAWVRTNWPDFAEHIEKKMFVLQWDDTNYPDETGLCWLEGEVPTPTYTHELYLSATLKYGGQVR